MRQSLLSLFIICFAFGANAQQDVDALNFSKTTIGGTARNMGTGGVMGSVGGDISSVINNPAGLAQFNQSEFTISPSMLFSNSKTNFLNENTTDFRSKFIINNLAVVIVTKNRRNRLKSSNWSFNLSRINNFTNKIYFDATNQNNSYTQSLAEILTTEVKKNNGLPIYKNNQLDPDEYNFFSMKPLNAYDTYLLNYDSSSKRIYSPIIGPVSQSGTITTTGGVNEFGINWAGNIDNKILVGLGLNFDFLDYTANTSYDESDFQNANATVFNKFNSTDNLRVTGVGTNLKAGILVKPNDYMRISAFLHTPTFYGLREEFSNQFSSLLPNGSGTDQYESNSPTTNFSYNLLTPWRIGAGITGIAKKIGFISAEYELTDYSDAFLIFDRANNGSFRNLQMELNKQITNKYALSHTIKIGGEYSYEQIRVRAGYAYRTGVFNGNIVPTGQDQSMQHLTGGFGYRGERFGIDFAYVRTIYKDYLSLYNVGGTDIGLANTNQFNHMVTTLTFKFR
jgi:hypothetical protein